MKFFFKVRVLQITITVLLYSMSRFSFLLLVRNLLSRKRRRKRQNIWGHLRLGLCNISQMRKVTNVFESTL